MKDSRAARKCDVCGDIHSTYNGPCSMSRGGGAMSAWSYRGGLFSQNGEPVQATEQEAAIQRLVTQANLVPELVAMANNVVAWLGEPPNENDDSPHANSARALIESARALLERVKGGV